jgi:hypothetical protein
MDAIEQALTDPENQPSQWGTVPVDDPNWIVLPWRPIGELDRTKDNTYLVRVEDGTGRGYIDKAYYADDEATWYEGNASEDQYIGLRFGKTERGPWKVIAFAPWPNYRAP